MAHPNQFSTFELLESRIAPATVTATLAGGKLTIFGDAGTNEVFLNSQTDGFNLTVSSGSHLVFNKTDLGDGATALIHGMVAEVSVDLGAGDDHFEVFGGSFSKDVTVKGGEGKDSIKTVNLQVGGTLSIDAGADDDTLMLESGLQVGKLAVDLGTGTNQLQFNFTHLGTEGDAMIKAGSGVDTITTTQATTFSIGGNLSIALGGGDDSIGFGQDALNAPALFEVGGKLGIVQGPHAGTFTVNLNPTDLRVRGDFSLAVDGKNGGTNNVNISGGTVAMLGKTAFKSTGAAADTVTINPAALTLDGVVSANLGDGKNAVTIGAIVSASLGSLSYKGGTGDDTLAFTSNSPITVLGASTVALGDGANALSEAYTSSTMQSLTFGGGLAVTGGKGADSVSLEVFDIAIGGAGAKLALGGGGDTVTLNTHNTLVIYGSLNATSGIGDTTVTLESPFLAVRGGVSATFGSGQDTLDLHGGRVEVAGGIKFTATGAGGDLLNLASGSDLGVKGATTLKGDAGALDFTVTANNEFDFGSVSITTKAGGGSTSFNGGGDIQGKFTYSGGTGANTLTMGREAYPTIYLHDAFAMTSAAATAGASLKLHNVTALAAVTTKLGAAADTVALDNASFLDALTLDTGDGGDHIDLGNDGSVNGNLVLYGAIRILAGAGDDTVALGGMHAVEIHAPAAAVLVDGGTGNDTVTNGQIFDGNGVPLLPTERNFETTS